MDFETSLRGDPPIEYPTAISVDPRSGSLCVTDEKARALDLFDSRGLHRFRTDLASRISRPQSGHLDAQGDFVLTDLEDGRQQTIRRLNFLGEPVAYEPEIPREGWLPQRLLLTRDGGYVTVSRTGLLAKHDPETGALLWMLELASPEWERADLLGQPAEAGDGRIYVPSADRGAVFLVSSDGRSDGAFGSHGTKRGELASPVGVAFAPDGHVLVLDQMRHVVLVFDSDHRFVTEFGHVGSGPGDFYFPLAIAAASDGRVFISQGFEGRVQVFRFRADEADGARTADDPAGTTSPASDPATTDLPRED
jgi:DNA-binding beta-propeller fold protein YncE